MYYLYFSFLDEGTASHLYILDDHQETTNNFSLKSKRNYTVQGLMVVMRSSFSGESSFYLELLP